MFRVILLVLLSFSAVAQQPLPEPQTAPAERRISPAEAEELFKSVDELTRFASADSGFAVRSSVKRKLISRDDVEKYITAKLNEDEDTKRLERSSLILKKFGLFPRDFELRPLLIKLLREQVAGYYDSREKTINLLDWLAPEAQRPVLAHELTHALQDQQVDLEKWLKEPDTLDLKGEYNKGVRSDEASLARTSVVEGQAMVVFIEYLLSQANRTLLDSPGFVRMIQDMTAQQQDTGALKEAPMILRESLMFPYREGFNFAYEVLKAEGKKAAFVELLKHPPINARQIALPATYLSGEKQFDALMPDLAPVLKGKYAKYDSGAVGQFDTKILLKQFEVARAEEIAKGWRGGMYYAGRKSTAEPKTEADVALLYVSYWQDEATAREFEQLYRRTIEKRYGNSEEYVHLVRSGRTVLSAEGFDRETAAALAKVVLSDSSPKKVAVDHGEMSLRFAHAMLR